MKRILSVSILLIGLSACNQNGYESMDMNEVMHEIQVMETDGKEYMADTESYRDDPSYWEWTEKYGRLNDRMDEMMPEEE